MAASDGVEDLLSVLDVARRVPVNFAVCMGKTPEATVIMMHRKRTPDQLSRDAKKAGETMKLAIGTANIEGSKLLLTCTGDPPAGLSKALKKYLKSIGKSLRVVLLSEAGELLESDEDDDEVGSAAGSAGPGDEKAGKWAKLLAALDPRVKGFVGRGGADGAKIEAIWAAAVTAAARGDFDTAFKAAQAISSKIGSGLVPQGTVAKRTFLLTRWRQIPVDLKVETDAFIGAVRTLFPDEDAPGLARAVQTRLTELIESMQSRVGDAIDKSINAGDPKYVAAIAEISRLRSEIRSNEVIQALAHNELSPGTGFAAAFLSALDEVETALAA